MKPGLPQLVSLVRGHRVAVVGVGDRRRGDDGVGSWIAERLSRRSSATVIDAETVPENFLGTLLSAAPERVLFVDAADHGGVPGEPTLAPARELAGRCASTHGLSLLLLARALEAHGIEAWLAGIQPASTAASDALSPAVRASARVLEDALAACLSAAEAAHA